MLIVMALIIASIECLGSRRNMSKGKEESKIRDRWGNNNIDAGPGWTAIPNFLLERQQALGLDPVQLNILLVMLKHWWEKDNKPYPSKKRMAETVNRSPDTVRKHIKEMELRGLVKRNKRFKDSDDGGGQTTNEYDLSGLVNKLEVFALEEIKEKKKGEARRAKKRRGNG